MAKKNEIVYNADWGGFSLSECAIRWLSKRGLEVDEDGRGVLRHNPLLVECVKELGERANGQFAHLKIGKIAGNTYRIDEYDGYETIQEPKDVKWVDIE